jgi:polyphosphate glucokinase
MAILGIDVGGSGIKAAPVHVETGALAAGRLRVETPTPSTPDAVTRAIATLVKQFAWTGPIGCAFPAVIKDGITHTAANVDRAWIGTNAKKLLENETGCPVTLLNDADAAGMAEVHFGAGQGRSGVLFVLTIGTGIGSAVFVDGHLMPNTELGHLILPSRLQGALEAEHYASDRVRKAEELTWEKWGARFNEYLDLLEALFAPDLFILGGGVSKKHRKLSPLLTTRAQIVPAKLLNNAGIVGAALAASLGS